MKARWGQGTGQAIFLWGWDLWRETILCPGSKRFQIRKKSLGQFRAGMSPGKQSRGSPLWLRTGKDETTWKVDDIHTVQPLRASFSNDLEILSPWKPRPGWQTPIPSLDPITHDPTSLSTTKKALLVIPNTEQQMLPDLFQTVSYKRWSCSSGCDWRA